MASIVSLRDVTRHSSTLKTALNEAKPVGPTSRPQGRSRKQKHSPTVKCLAAGTSAPEAPLKVEVRPLDVSASPVAAEEVEVRLDEETNPPWTGTSPLSGFVNFLINTEPIYKVLIRGGRDTFKKTAKKNGIPWDAIVEDLRGRQQELETLYRETENSQVAASYPSYYTMRFHGYEQGNLCWDAAYELEMATTLISCRAFKEANIEPSERSLRMRNAYLDALSAYWESKCSGSVFETAKEIVDVGCSGGVSTRHLSDRFPSARVTGVDLSPHFLSLAKLRDLDLAEAAASGKPVNFEFGANNEGWKRRSYLHANADSTGLPSQSVDLVTALFMFHELPSSGIRECLREARRILKPGGVIMMVDNNPRSRTIQGLPPVLFTIMKATEPHSDDFYNSDQCALLEEEGFIDAVSIPSDHRHRAVLGRVPL